MTKRTKAIFIIAIILMLSAVIMLFTTLASAITIEERPRSRTVYSEEGREPPTYGVAYQADEPLEDPNESELIAQACIDTIGTEKEIETIGYDISYVMKVITAEGGTDQDMCFACAQALFNAYIKHQAKYNPEEMCRKYQYTQPAEWISDEARYACEQIFLYGNMYDKVEDATVFYNPSYGWSAYHESQELVCEINGVNFYRETN